MTTRLSLIDMPNEILVMIFGHLPFNIRKIDNLGCLRYYSLDLSMSLMNSHILQDQTTQRTPLFSHACQQTDL